MLLLAAVWAACAAPALAAPSEPILTLTDLRGLLAASPSGSVDGFFKTVASGSTIQDIPCTVLGIAVGAGPGGDDLIFIQARGTLIEQVGGIAEGMSGSPLYVSDGGQEKLVGAVSYGEAFTTGGFGLATPIEQMIGLEESEPAGGASGTAASVTVRTRGGASYRVAIESGTATAAAAQPSVGTLTMRPLGLIELGGIPENSAVYRQLAADLAERGVALTHGTAAAASGGDAGFSVPLVAGASVGALYTRGDLWFGGVGTVTYVTPADTVVAFGHPLGLLNDWGDSDGATSAYMTCADVLGIWANQYFPFKMATPGAVAGEISFDGLSGIRGTVGASPTDVPFVSTATNAVTGLVRTSTVDATPALVNSLTNVGVTACLVYPAMWRATGDANFAGTIDYHLVMTVSDGVHEYVVDRRNSEESDTDAPTRAVYDTAVLLDELLANRDGMAPCSIESVHIDSTLSPAHRTARILDVSVPGGLKVGDNTVHVTLHPYGAADNVDQTVTLTIPAGTDLSAGELYVTAPDTDMFFLGGFFFDLLDSSGPLRSLEDVVALLNALPANTEVQVVYAPESGFEDSDDSPGSQPITASADTGAVLEDDCDKPLAAMRLRADRGVISAGAGVTLMGSLIGNSEDTTVDIYRREFGSATRTLIASGVPVVGDSSPYADGPSVFVCRLSNVRRGATYTASWAGDAASIGASASVRVKVKARVALSAVSRPGHAVRLTAKVTPLQDSGVVRFQRRSGSRWLTFKTVPLSSAGTAAFTWRAAAGSYSVRALFPGSTTNVRATSPVRQVVL